MSVSIRKLCRAAVLGLAISSLALAPTAAWAVPQAPAAGSHEIGEGLWSWFADLGASVLAAVGLGSGSDADLTDELLTAPEDVANQSSSGDESDSGYGMDPNG